jgi:hypothetical protein
MALLALQFSRQYKERLVNGKKRHTLVDHPLYLIPGQKLLVYVSKSDDIENSNESEKIGLARVVKTLVIAVKDITDTAARMMGHKSRKELLVAVKKWYQIRNESILTYIEFDLFSKRGEGMKHE